MFCNHCGAKIEDDALFCEECGNRVEKIKPESKHVPKSNPVKKEKKKNLPVLVAVILATAVVLAVVVCLVVSIVFGNKRKDSESAKSKSIENQVMESKSSDADGDFNSSNVDADFNSGDMVADLNAMEVSQFELNGSCVQASEGKLYLITDEVFSVYAADSFNNAHYYAAISEFTLTSDFSENLNNVANRQISVSGSLYAIDEENVGLMADYVEILDKGSRMEMDYCDNSSITYPDSASDFTEVTCPDGSYTLMYPKSVFADGYYDEDTESYYFSSADESLVLSVEKQEATIKNDPVSSANYMMHSVSSLFVEGNETPYIHESSSVAESGFSRAIIGGQTKSDLGKGKYILYACNSENVYKFEFSFPYGGTSGITIDYTECGYMLDCMYRGWSISGSTRELRTFNQYMTDDMGAKKED